MPSITLHRTPRTVKKPCKTALSAGLLCDRFIVAKFRMMESMLFPSNTLFHSEEGCIQKSAFKK